MRYFYKGQEVFPIEGQLFSTHWNCNVPTSTEGGGTKMEIKCLSPDMIEHRDGENTPTEESADVLTVEAIATVNINTGTFDEIKKVLGGMGAGAVRTLIRNRPYKNFKEVQSKNPTVKAQWEIVETLLTY